MPLAIMTVAGWIFMMASWIIIIGVTFFCFFKVLRMSRFKDPKD